MKSNFVFKDSNNITYDFSDVFIRKEFFVDGTLYSWGYNTFSGILGLGDTLHRSSPTQVGSLTNWFSIAMGSNDVNAIKTDGTLWSWGKNQYGQLGQNDTTSRSSPTQVGALSNWKHISGVGLSYGGIKTDGTLWTWGYAPPVSDGVLGLGDNVHRSSPTQVGALSNWKQLSVGSDHMAAIKTDGTLWIWGANDKGELGDGTVIPKSSPIQVGSLTNWASVNCGYGFWGITAAIKNDGTLWTWGYDAYGMLGLGDAYVSRSSPTQVGSLTNWRQVSCGYSSAAVKNDGTLWTWGNDGGWGTLGIGNIYATDNYLGSKLSPVQVGTLRNWKEVRVGYRNMMAIKYDGTLWTWGFNENGKLGLGNIINISSPTQIGPLTYWKTIACGYSSSLALTHLDLL